MTGKQMCEEIVEALKTKYNIDITPEQIWNLENPDHGSLYHVYGLYYSLVKGYTEKDYIYAFHHDGYFPDADPHRKL